MELDTRHVMHGSIIPKKSLKTRNSFFKGTIKLNKTPSESGLDKWEKETNSENQWLQPKKTLPPSYENKWQIWKSLNRLRAVVGRCKVNMKKWGQLCEENTTRSCGQEQSMAHSLRCPETRHTCSEKDLI